MGIKNFIGATISKTTSVALKGITFAGDCVKDYQLAESQIVRLKEKREKIKEQLEENQTEIFNLEQMIKEGSTPEQVARVKAITEAEAEIARLKAEEAQ